jgi:hypothetical protein
MKSARLNLAKFSCFLLHKINVDRVVWRHIWTKRIFILSGQRKRWRAEISRRLFIQNAAKWNVHKLYRNIQILQSQINTFERSRRNELLTFLWALVFLWLADGYLTNKRLRKKLVQRVFWNILETLSRDAPSNTK